MDLQALKDEIQNDPKGKGYLSWMPDSPGMVLYLLNQTDGLAMKSISAAQGLTWAAAGAYSNIIDTSNNISHPCRASCLAILDVFRSGQVIHMELPDLQALFSAWLTATIITQDQYDALIAIAMQPASRLEVLGLGPVTEANLHAALELP